MRNDCLKLWREVTAFYAKNHMKSTITLWEKCSVQVF